MDNQTRQLIQSIHDCALRLVLVTAGAGTHALSDLLGVAGASRTLLEGLVPYSAAAFDEFLGQQPAQYVASEAAQLMAGRAYTRARWLASAEPYPVVGVACTATIITDRPKRGEHRAHIATWQPQRLVCSSIHLEKGTRDRTGEEDMVSRLMLNAVANSCGKADASLLPLPLKAGDKLVVETFDFVDIVKQLAQRTIDYFSITEHGHISTTAAGPAVLLSGSFNPLHDGHLALARTAAAIVGQPAAFELTAVNADKPPLPSETVLQRMAQFAGRYPIVVSNAPTFVEKARLYPGSTFVVGYDTAVRILYPRYYHDSNVAMIQALSDIRDAGCRFLVAGRINEHGHFRKANDLAVPAQFTNLFQAIPDVKFRNDISSTELRRTGRKGSR